MNQHLWQESAGYYGQYLYGRNYLTLSPRAEALGEALSVWFGVADEARAKAVVARTPITDFGVPCIYPQIPGIPPYHNNAVWPFVQSYWALAAAKVGNEASLTESMAAIYRPAALFLTNKENFVAQNGDYAGTQINSSNMLWSLSGSLSLVYKILFGMHYEPDRLVFRPFVPQAFRATASLPILNTGKRCWTLTCKDLAMSFNALPSMASRWLARLCPPRSRVGTRCASYSAAKRHPRRLSTK
jgi:hypothetical protein